jgi:hypothetical protein
VGVEIGHQFARTSGGRLNAADPKDLWVLLKLLLPRGGHALLLEKDHRRFQHEVLSFFD